MTEKAVTIRNYIIKIWVFPQYPWISSSDPDLVTVRQTQKCPLLNKKLSISLHNWRSNLLTCITTNMECRTNLCTGPTLLLLIWRLKEYKSMVCWQIADCFFWCLSKHLFNIYVKTIPVLLALRSFYFKSTCMQLKLYELMYQNI